ncbi:MAG: hypothetical protein K8R92_07975 [Planctomycetes bacterium]|nr:hypothetical protein [Planctomycetota bacterium]
MFAAALFALAGCHATVLTPSPADALRQQNQELEAKNSALEAQVEELQAQLAIKGDAATKSPTAEVEQATPRLAKISIGSLSRVGAKHAADGEPFKPGELLVFLYVEDGKGRPFQLTGDLHLEATVHTPFGFTSLASAQWGPLQLRDRYRSGFGTPHYSLTVPIIVQHEVPDATALVILTYTDGWTGRTMKVDRTVPLTNDDFSKENPDKSE